MSTEADIAPAHAPRSNRDITEDKDAWRGRSTFRHFKGLTLLLSDLRAKYAGLTGIWQAFTPPSGDGLGRQTPLGYYEGLFEDVVHAVILEHRGSFLDGRGSDPMCGEIVPIVPKLVGPRPDPHVDGTHKPSAP